MDIGYNKTSIIAGKEITFTDKQRKDTATFHKSRLAFAFKDGEPLVNLHDEREHRVYLREDFGIDDIEFETLIRGYIKPGKIIFYITSHHSEVEMVPPDFIQKCKLLAYQQYGAGTYTIHNGVHIGEPGTEWEPIKTIGKANLFNSVEYFDELYATEFMQPKQILLVRAASLHTGEMFMYIGTVDPREEQYNTEHVLKNGAKIPISILRNLVK